MLNYHIEKEAAEC